MTPTAKLADIVLPACTFLEKSRFTVFDAHPDHGWNVPGRVVLSPKAIEPLYESWSDWKIICELGRRLGFADHFPWACEEDSIDDTLKPLGIDCAALRSHPEGIQIRIPPLLYKKMTGPFGTVGRFALAHTLFHHYPDMYRKYEGFMRGFNTPSKKVELYSTRLEAQGFDPLPVYREPAESPVSRPDLAHDYPFVLISGSKLGMYTQSMMRNIPGLRGERPANLAEIHPDAARRLGISDQEDVRIVSPRGAIVSRAQVTDRIRPDVIHVSHGFEESNANVLTDNAPCDPITGSTGLKSALCRVEKIATA
jgi:anaerobic selenocysteine-containing dehydrogenase